MESVAPGFGSKTVLLRLDPIADAAIFFKSSSRSSPNYRGKTSLQQGGRTMDGFAHPTKRSEIEDRSEVS